MIQGTPPLTSLPCPGGARGGGEGLRCGDDPVASRRAAEGGAGSAPSRSEALRSLSTAAAVRSAFLGSSRRDARRVGASELLQHTVSSWCSPPEALQLMTTLQCYSTSSTAREVLIARDHAQVSSHAGQTSGQWLTSCAAARQLCAVRPPHVPAASQTPACQAARACAPTGLTCPHLCVCHRSFQHHKHLLQPTHDLGYHSTNLRCNSAARLKVRYRILQREPELCGCGMWAQTVPGVNATKSAKHAAQRTVGGCAATAARPRRKAA